MTLLSMSLSGGCIILAAALLRALARDRLPVWSFEALWALAWLRLLAPVRLPWRWSVWSALARLAPANAGPALATLPGAAAAMPGGSVDIISELPPAAPAMSPWTAVWLAGAAALAAGYGLLWLWWRRRFRAGSTVETGAAPAFLAAHPLRRHVCVRRWARPEAPLTYALFRPVILLGDSAPWQDEGAMDCVLAHELAHIRRLDGARRALLWLAVCVHWFDPLVWLMAALACRDMERACDRAALAMLGQEARKDYARALLDMAGRRAGSAPAAGFSKNAIEERIHSIMKTRKTTLLSGLLSLALVLALGAAFATSAAADAPPVGALGDVVTSSDGTVTVYDDEGEPIEMTREEFKDFLDPVEVEWWTAEEYAAWLEQEKKELQDCLGQRAWTNADGWFTWTQDKIDEAIAMYEQTLRDIENGLLVSKSVDGSADVMLAQGSAPDEISAEAQPVLEGDGIVTVPPSKSVALFFEQADGAPYGILESGGRIRAGQVTAAKGSTVSVSLTARTNAALTVSLHGDSTHMGQSVELEAGQPQTVTFSPEETATYEIYVANNSEYPAEFIASWIVR